MKIKETDLAKALIASFDGTQYEIYQEVETLVGIADVVLKHANFLWAIEVKTSLSLQVLGQAFENKQLYHYSSICVPRVRANKGTAVAEKFCRDHGIGIFHARIDTCHNAAVETLRPRINRHARVKNVRLSEIQKTYADAGNSNGDRWTPFNQTVNELKRYVTRNPGCRLKDAMAEIGHHYASIGSATSSIRTWIDKGVITGIENKRGILRIV